MKIKILCKRAKINDFRLTRVRSEHFMIYDWSFVGNKNFTKYVHRSLSKTTEEYFYVFMEK